MLVRIFCCALAPLLFVFSTPALAQTPAGKVENEHSTVPPAIQAADTLPPNVRGMLEAAARTKDAAQVAAVAYAASEVFPAHRAGINEYGDYLRGVINPMSGLDIETILVHAPEEEEKAPPKVEARTAEQAVASAPAPKFLDLGDWTGKVTASGLIATGNSRNAAAGLVAEATLPDGDFTHNLRGYFNYGRSFNPVLARSIKTQQSWGASYKLDYAVGENTFAYGRFSYDEDEFSGFDYRLFAGLGAGHWFVRDEKLAFKLEGGPGYRYQPIDDTREVNSHFAFYAAEEFDWVIREGLKFEQDFSITWTQPTTTLISTTGISVAFTDSLSTGFSYIYRFETAPPPPRVKTDTTFRANLTYGF